MKITTVCKDCGQKRQFKSLWAWLFREDYDVYKAKNQVEDIKRAMQEIPEVMAKIEQLEVRKEALMQKLGPELASELHMLSQDMMFQGSRLKNLLNIK